MMNTRNHRPDAPPPSYKPGFMIYAKALFIAILMFLMTTGIFAFVAAALTSGPWSTQGAPSQPSRLLTVLAYVGATLIAGLVAWACFRSTVKTDVKKRTTPPPMPKQIKQRKALKRVCVIAANVAIIFGLVLIGIIAWPALKGPDREAAQRNGCLNHMRQIDGGKEQWAMATGQTNGALADLVGVNDYIKGTTTPICPVGGVYTYGPIGAPPACSIHGPLP